MQTMTGKEVLRAIADGANLTDFEVEFDTGKWQTVDYNASVVRILCTSDMFRRKPRTRVINGFTVPAPIQSMPKHGDVVWWVDLFGSDWAFDASYDPSSVHDENYYRRGLLFNTKEAAVANAKAMCGIDPNT